MISSLLAGALHFGALSPARLGRNAGQPPGASTKVLRGPRYLFRLDDIAPNMHWGNYCALREIFDQNGVRPLIGVIPDNQDEQLLRFPRVPTDFWAEIRNRQAAGWQIGLHGYQHQLRRSRGGRLRVNPFGEFADLSFERQREMIRAACAIFEREGLTPGIFVAPAHTFDDATLDALRAASITRVSDGYALGPYRRRGVLHIPQILATPRRCLWGTWTFCLHPNQMEASQIQQLGRFIVRNRDRIAAFSDIGDDATTAWTARATEAILLPVLAWSRARRRRKLAAHGL